MRGSGWNECEKSVPLFLQQSGMQRRVSEGGTRVADEWCPSVRPCVTSPVQLHRLSATTALHRLTAPTALHRLTAPTALHRLTAPTALQCQRQTQSSISIICTPKLLCQNIEISNAKIRRAPTFGHINKSRKHLTHSKFSKHGNFTKFKPSETSHVHLVSILRIPVFDRMQKKTILSQFSA